MASLSTALGQPQPVIYRVDANSTAPNPDGSSWSLAFKNPQEILNHAIFSLADGDQIWVSGGILGAEKTYYPDEGTGQTDNNRAATFQLPTVSNATTGISILGGFAGTENLASERNPNRYITILSGDIDKNSTLDGNNSTHVVTGTGVPSSSTIILDGFTIVGGYANENGDEDSSGGGIIVFEDGYGPYGNPQIRNCTIRDNYAAIAGGGAAFKHAKGAFINCTFQNNSAGTAGGGLHLTGYYWDPENVTTEVINCQFIGNSAVSHGGGAQAGNGAPKFTNCLFYENSVTGTGSVGGAMHIYCDSEEDDELACAATDPVITNCTFTGNTATQNGGKCGGVATGGAASGWSPVMKNCIFFGNDDTTDESSPQEKQDANLWHFDSMIAAPLVRDSLIYAIVEDGYFDDPGETNVEGNPLFVSSAADDYRLQSGSPCHDTGDDTVVSADSYDADSDGNMTENTPDNDLFMRVNSERVDMGAFERKGHIYVNQAAKGTNNGQSWNNAYSTLQPGMTYARTANTGVTEIWVAEGT